MAPNEIDAKLAEELGANEFVLSQRFTIYLPNMGRDKNGKPTVIAPEKLDEYVNEAKNLLGKMNQGATAYPEADGIWWKRGADQPVYERTRIVYTFVDPEIFFSQLELVREFLHRFGRETRQDQVLVEFDGFAYQIEEYDGQSN